MFEWGLIDEGDFACWRGEEKGLPRQGPALAGVWRGKGELEQRIRLGSRVGTNL